MLSTPTRRKHLIHTIFIVVCLTLFFLLAHSQAQQDFENDILENLQISTENRAIRVSWSAPTITMIDKVEISISEPGMTENQHTIYVSPHQQAYMFENGRLNTCYQIDVSAQYKDGRTEHIESARRLFMDMGDVPKLPTLYITTSSGNDPTSTLLEHPEEDLLGTTSIENDYEKGFLTYVAFGKTIESKMKIRVRGNSSSMGEKKPYKIVLDHPMDMTNSGSAYAHKEWLLLMTGTTLNNHLGETISEYCGVEWVPHSIYINVFLNGDWKGCYTLVENVSKSESHGNVSENGYIIENDAYWWNEDEVYFRLNGQGKQMAYTFKYPKMTSDDSRIEDIRCYFQEFVDMCMAGNENAWTTADVDSFAAFVLTRDVMQIADPAGSNIYYYINDFSSKNRSKSVLKMGPVWDFDSAFSSSMYPCIHTLSSQHHVNYLPFVENETFEEAYRERWQAISDGLLPTVTDDLTCLYAEEGTAIEQSRMLETARWGWYCYPLEDEISMAESWMEDQIEFINSIVGGQ